MAHVQIKPHEDDDRSSVLVDGTDIAPFILAEGAWVDLSPLPLRPALVHVVIPADVLDIDLPEALLEATRQGGEN